MARGNVILLSNLVTLLPVLQGSMNGHILSTWSTKPNGKNYWISKVHTPLSVSSDHTYSLIRDLLINMGHWWKIFILWVGLLSKNFTYFVLVEPWLHLKLAIMAGCLKYQWKLPVLGHFVECLWGSDQSVKGSYNGGKVWTMVALLLPAV